MAAPRLVKEILECLKASKSQPLVSYSFGGELRSRIATIEIDGFQIFPSQRVIHNRTVCVFRAHHLDRNKGSVESVTGSASCAAAGTDAGRGREAPDGQLEVG